MVGSIVSSAPECKASASSLSAGTRKYTEEARSAFERLLSVLPEKAIICTDPGLRGALCRDL